MIRPRIPGIPLHPPGPINHVTHVRVLERDPCIVSPGTTQVEGSGGDGLAGLRGDGALVEDVEVWVRGRGAARGGDVAGAAEDADVDRVEPGGGVLAEDEVGAAGYEGLGVELGAGLGEECVCGEDELVGFCCSGGEGKKGSF